MSDTTEPRLQAVLCSSPGGLHRMAYWEWGAPDNDRVLLCAHGLTRTGRDFDTLARRLARRYRVVCPDVVGRGRSDWLANASFYTVPQYVGDMLTLLARIQPRELHWVGTSMGGLIGLGLAGARASQARLIRPEPNGAWSPMPAELGQLRFASMTLNDVGPHLEAGALARITEYLAQPLVFPSFELAVAYVRQVSASFGPHSETQWQELTRHVFVQTAAGWVKHYDPGIALAVNLDGAALAMGEQILWQAYASLECPVLICRGNESDLFARRTAYEMLERHDRAQLAEFEGVGHAPTFMQAEQLAVLEDFLAQAV
ncbi:alpha/beta hydrolase [Alcaligenaceae bacterium SJ-26]|nr:alpha/beta hydrolase [Alcaligenaceae bacterium SJ-26]